MKITKLLFLFSLVFATVSCNKDDDNITEPYTLSTANFVDTYKLKFLETKEVETYTFDNGTTSESTSTIVGSVLKNVSFVFNSKNEYTANGLFNTVKTTIKADGTTEVGEIEIVNLDEAGIYTLNTTNSKVTLTDSDGKVRVFEIKDYTESEMTLYSETTTTSGSTSKVTSTEYRFTR